MYVVATVIQCTWELHELHFDTNIKNMHASKVLREFPCRGTCTHQRQYVFSLSLFNLTVCSFTRKDGLLMNLRMGRRWRVVVPLCFRGEWHGTECRVHFCAAGWMAKIAQAHLYTSGERQLPWRGRDVVLSRHNVLRRSAEWHAGLATSAIRVISTSRYYASTYLCRNLLYFSSLYKLPQNSMKFSSGVAIVLLCLYPLSALQSSLRVRALSNARPYTASLVKSPDTLRLRSIF